MSLPGLRTGQTRVGNVVNKNKKSNLCRQDEKKKRVQVNLLQMFLNVCRGLSKDLLVNLFQKNLWIFFFKFWLFLFQWNQLLFKLDLVYFIYFCTSKNFF